MPERFGLSYQGGDGERHQPVMIHRALFGSVERFIGVLTEHYAGAFPPWLAPVQVIGVPVADEYVDYLHDVAERLRANGIRVEVDASDDRMPKKIRNASKAKVPFVLIAGEEDKSKGAVSLPLPRRLASATASRSARRSRRSSRPSRPGPRSERGPAGRRPRDGRSLPAVRRRPGRLRAAVDPAPDGLHRRRGQAGRSDDPAQCPFCASPGRSDEEGLIVRRGSGATPC